MTAPTNDGPPAPLPVVPRGGHWPGRALSRIVSRYRWAAGAATTGPGGVPLSWALFRDERPEHADAVPDAMPTPAPPVTRPEDRPADAGGPCPPEAWELYQRSARVLEAGDPEWPETMGGDGSALDLAAPGVGIADLLDVARASGRGARSMFNARLDVAARLRAQAMTLDPHGAAAFAEWTRRGEPYRAWHNTRTSLLIEAEQGDGYGPLDTDGGGFHPAFRALAERSAAVCAAVAWSTVAAVATMRTSAAWQVAEAIVPGADELDGVDRAQAVGALASALAHEAAELRDALEMAGPSPGALYVPDDVADPLNTPGGPGASHLADAERAALRRDDDGCLWLDTALSRWLDGRPWASGTAHSVRTNAIKRAASWPALPFPGWSDRAGWVWRTWVLPDDGVAFPACFPWLDRLARDLWSEKVHPPLARVAELRAPALPYHHARASVRLVDRRETAAPEGDRVHVAVSPGLRVEMAAALWSRRGSTLALQALPGWCAKMAHAAEAARNLGASEWWAPDGSMRAFILEGPSGFDNGPAVIQGYGGLDVLCEAIGLAAHRDNLDAVKDAIAFYEDASLERDEDAEVTRSRWILSSMLPKRGRAAPGAVRWEIQLSHELRPRHRRSRLVPALGLAPLPETIDRAQWPAVAALDHRALIDLTLSAPEVVTEGGAMIDRARLAADVGLPTSTADKAWNAWEGERWITRPDGRMTLAATTAELRDALALIRDGGELVTARRKGAQRKGGGRGGGGRR